MKVPERAGYGHDNGGSRAEPRAENEVVFACGIRTTMGKPCTRPVSHQGGGKPMCAMHYGRHIDAILKK